MTAQFTLVIEANLAATAYGASISTTEPVAESDALELLDRIARGEAPEVYSLYKRGVTVRVSERQLIDISRGRATSTRQTRITLAEIASDRR